MECVKSELQLKTNHKYDACKNEKPCQGAKCITLVGGVKPYWCECLRGYTRQSHKVCTESDFDRPSKVQSLSNQGYSRTWQVIFNH